MRHFKQSYVDLGYRMLSAHRLPMNLMPRIANLGIPQETVDKTLKSIRRLDGWSTAWVETAQGYLGMCRRETSSGNVVEAEKARQLAAMCYHVAQILEIRDMRTRNNCRAWAASLVKQSLAVCRPNARHILVPWRDRQLPALFELPDKLAEPFGLVVLFNGVSQSKEETILLAPRFLAAGYAVLAIDSPGTGEATSMGPLSATATDILDGMLQMLRHESAIDLSRLVLVGSSFGGSECLRIAGRVPETMAVVTVTPAVAPDAWMDHASPLLLAELQDVVADHDAHEVAQSFDATVAADCLNLPLLIFGAARDIIVPPNESQKLAQRVGENATLVWYPDQGHCLYGAAEQWTSEAVTWISAIAEARDQGVTTPNDLNAFARSAIEQSVYRPLPVANQFDDDFTEFARLLPADELAGN